MKTTSALILVLLLSFLFHIPSEAYPESNTWYVSPTGTGGECTQAEPCQINTATQIKSAPGDTILAKSGDYYAPSPTDSYLVYLYKSLKITGSCQWEPTGPVTCHPENYTSNLRANLEMRGVAIQGIPGDGMSVLIEGFTIIQGNSESVGPGTCINYGSSTVLGCGGGIFAEGVDRLELRNNYITNNFASRGATTAASLGGGIYAENVGQLVVKENVFHYNRAGEHGYGYGGGIFITNSGTTGGIQIENNLFYGNDPSTDTDLTMGGAIFTRNSEDVYIHHNVFSFQNQMFKKSIYGSAIYLIYTSNSYIYANSFNNNYGMSSIRVDGLDGDMICKVNIQMNKITREETAINIEIWGKIEALVANNFIGANDSTDWGGGAVGIYSIGGGTMGNPDIYAGYNTFALLSHGLYIEHDSDMNADKNIFTQIYQTAIYSTDPAYSIITVNENLFHNNTQNGITGTTYFTGDPLLVEPSTGDFHIQPGSAAIDKVYSWQGGIDIDGQVRPVGPEPNNFDIGADEYMLQIFLPMISK